MVVEARLLIGGELAVGALVLLPGQHFLMVVLGVAFEEASGLELLAAEHAGVYRQRLAVGADDDGYVVNERKRET